MKPLIYYVTNIAPLYRKKLWATLLESEHFEIINFFGENTSSGIKAIDLDEGVFAQNSSRLRPIKNIWIKGKYLIWQRGVLRRLLFDKMDLVILLGEFLILSNWFAAIICRIRGIKVVFQGHGIYGNEGSLKLFFRKTFYQLANAHLLYERRAKQIMITEGFKSENLHVFFNSLDYDVHKSLRASHNQIEKKQLFSFFDNPEAYTFIFVGRLTKIKKLDMVIRAVADITSSSFKVNLLVIGDGVEKNALEKLASEVLSPNSYHFYGACYDENMVGNFLAASDICVSPGNVGLTAVHSLSSGTPVCTHDNFENQMPEVEALEADKTGVFFKENDLEDMIRSLKEWFLENDMDRQEVRNSCFEVIDTYYNPYYQERVMKNLVENGNAMV